MSNRGRIADILKKHEQSLLSDWLRLQLASSGARADLIKESELRDQSAHFLAGLRDAAQQGNLTNINGPEWKDVRELLADISRSRAVQGFTPTETATFIFSLKEPLFAHLQKECGQDFQALASETLNATGILDKLGLYTTESFIKSREGIIASQQQEMMELSTPVVQLWENILALPLIGTLDSARTQVVMENLLQKIVETGALIAIIDITGVPTVDTLVAQHLIKTVSAARLMGADCIISGIRPQIAQTIVHLGVNLMDIITKASLADAFAVALQRTGSSVVRIERRA
jgi:rsbT co-antagonist protein RsbR